MKNILKKVIIPVLALSLIFTGCSSAKDGSNGNDKGTDDNKSVYPEKTVQLTVPYKAGGDTDIGARILAKYLNDELGQPVVIVNTEGGGGSVAARSVMDSSADGYTGLFWHSSILLNDLIGISDFSYDAFKIISVPFVSDVGVWIVNSNSPYHTVEDVINQLKKESKSLSYATAIGNYSHLQAVIFEDVAGVQMKKVDLGGTANNIAAILGEQVDIVSGEYGIYKDYIESGDLRVIGSLAENRSKLIPDVPTFKEQGIDMTNGFEKLYFLAFPKETPDDVVETFANAIDNVMKKEESLDELANLMFTPKLLYGQEASDYIKSIDETYKKYKEKLINDKF